MAVFEEGTARRNLEMRNIFWEEERVKELALFEAVQFLATEKNQNKRRRKKNTKGTENEKRMKHPNIQNSKLV